MHRTLIPRINSAFKIRLQYRFNNYSVILSSFANQTQLTDARPSPLDNAQYHKVIHES